MSGTKAGGARASATIRKVDPNHYREMGRLGGKSSRGGLKGFANPNHSFYGKAAAAGSVGGKISKRGQRRKMATPKLRDARGRFMKEPTLSEHDWGISPAAVREISPTVIITRPISNLYYVVWMVGSLVGMGLMLLLGATIF